MRQHNIQQIRAHRLLLVDWFSELACSLGHDLRKSGQNSDTFFFGDTNRFHVSARHIDKYPFLHFVPNDPDRQNTVNEIVQMIIDRVDKADVGGTIWHSTELYTQDKLNMSISFLPSLMERLGMQQRILGWRRLGRYVLLHFAEDIPPQRNAKNVLIAPKTIIQAHLAVSAPCEGYFSLHLAQYMLEIVAAICTFALGRAVTLPPALFASNSESLAQLIARQSDEAVKTLARKHVSLDIFSQLELPGGFELLTRMRAALLAFSAAMQQERDAIACIMYVVAAESLTTPYTRWRQSKLTKRFIEFFDDLMPNELDRIVAHGNFEEAFGIRRRNRSARALRRELLERIYDYRSVQLHDGLDLDYTTLGAAIGGEVARRALLADFAEGAILRYLAAPRGSLIGHPRFESLQQGIALGFMPAAVRSARFCFVPGS